MHTIRRAADVLTESFWRNNRLAINENEEREK